MVARDDRNNAIWFFVALSALAHALLLIYSPAFRSGSLGLGSTGVGEVVAVVAEPAPQEVVKRTLPEPVTDGLKVVVPPSAHPKAAPAPIERTPVKPQSTAPKVTAAVAEPAPTPTAQPAPAAGAKRTETQPSPAQTGVQPQPAAVKATPGAVITPAPNGDVAVATGDASGNAPASAAGGATEKATAQPQPTDTSVEADKGQDQSPPPAKSPPPPPKGNSMIANLPSIGGFPKDATNAGLRAAVTIIVDVHVDAAGNVVTAVAESAGYPQIERFAANYARRGVEFKPYERAYDTQISVTFDPAGGGSVVPRGSDKVIRLGPVASSQP